jgi:folate-binding protein YgfZ
VPRYGADFDETHYPQEAGLKERAVSFTKGCYLGQEVVCTLENRGQLRRRMMLIEGEGLEPGQALEGADGKKLGEVRSTLGHRAFAVLRRAATEGVDEVPVAGGRSVRILRVL